MLPNLPPNATVAHSNLEFILEFRQNISDPSNNLDYSKLSDSIKDEIGDVLPVEHKTEGDSETLTAAFFDDTDWL